MNAPQLRTAINQTIELSKENSANLYLKTTFYTNRRQQKAHHKNQEANKNRNRQIKLNKAKHQSKNPQNEQNCTVSISEA